MRLSLNFLLNAVFCPSSALRQMLQSLNATLPYAQTRFNLLLVVNGPKCFSLCACTVLVHWLLIASGLHFCLNLLGFSFIFWRFSHPAVLLLQVENGPKQREREKKNNKRHQGGTCEHTSVVCQGERTSPFIRLCGIFLHYSHQSFRVQAFSVFLPPQAKQESAVFVFQRGSSASSCASVRRKSTLRLTKEKKKAGEVLRSRSLSK